jgi:hypothetical protein
MSNETNDELYNQMVAAKAALVMTDHTDDPAHSEGLILAAMNSLDKIGDILDGERR